MGEIDMIKAAVSAIDKVGAKVLPEDVVKIAQQSAMAGAGIALIPEGATVPIAIFKNIDIRYGNATEYDI